MRSWRQKASFCSGLARAPVIGVAAVCGLALMTVPVLAQFGRFGGGGQSFDSFFSPYLGAAHASRARRSTPAARRRRSKPDAQPTGGSVLVLGDSMADWLAYGLEDALGDPPDLGVVRKNRASSGSDPLRLAATRTRIGRR